MSNVLKNVSLVLVAVLAIAGLQGCPKVTSGASDTLGVPKATSLTVNASPVLGMLSVGESNWFTFATKKGKTYGLVVADDTNNTGVSLTSELFIQKKNDKDKDVLQLVSLSSKLLSVEDGVYFVRLTNNSGADAKVEVNYAIAVQNAPSADADVTATLTVAATKDQASYQSVFVAGGQTTWLKMTVAANDNITVDADGGDVAISSFATTADNARVNSGANNVPAGTVIVAVRNNNEIMSEVLVRAYKN